MTGTVFIVSIMLPYFCSECFYEEKIELNLSEAKSNPPKINEKITCNNCQGTMVFDDIVDSYLLFLQE